MKIQLSKIVIVILFRINICQILLSRVPTAKLNIDLMEPYDIALTSDGNNGYMVGYQGELAYLDLTDDFNPQVISQISLQQTVKKIILTSDEQLLIITTGINGLIFIQTQNPINLQECQQVPYQNIINTISVQFLSNQDQNKLVVSKSDGFEILDISTIDNVRVLANITIDPNSEVAQAAITQDLRFAFFPVFIGTPGYYVYDISDFNHVHRVSLGSNPDKQGIYRIVLHPTRKIAFIMQRMDYLFSVEYKSLYNRNQDELEHLGEWEDKAQAQKNDMIITSDGNQIILAVKGYGLYILNVANPSKMILMQQVKISGFISSIHFDYSEKFVYYTDLENLGILSDIPESFNLDLPNLFNVLRGTFWENNGTEKMPMELQFNNDNSRLWVAYGIDGVRLFDSSNLPDIELLRTYNTSDFPFINNKSVSMVELNSLDQNIIFMAVKNTGILVANFSNYNTPHQLGSINIIGDHQDLMLIKNNTVLVVASGPQGIRLINVTKLSNLVIISLIKSQNYVYFIAVNQAENILVGSYKDYGISIYDIENLNSPVLKSNYFTGGGQSMKFLSRDPNIMILADGVMGVKILDLKNPTNPEQITQIQLPGVSINIEVSLDENYIYVSATDAVLITCLKIQDLTQITIFQTLNTGESGLGTAMTTQQDYLAVGTYGGIKILQLKPKLNINTETFALNQDTGLLERRNIREQGFYVGEECYIYFTIIGDPFVQIIESAQQYDDGFLTPFQNWLNYDDNLDLIQLDVNKDGVGDFQIVTINKLQVQESFITFTNNQAEKADILNELQDLGFINSEYYVTSFFDEDKTIYFRDSSLNIYSQQVKNMLSNTIYYLPSLIPIRASMNFTPNDINHTISTINDLIEIKLTVLLGDGKFVKQIFESVSVDFNYPQTTISMIGSMITVNEQLQNVRFSRQRPLAEIQLKVELNDNINTPIEETLNIQNLTCLKQNHLVEVSNTLQNQIQQIYDGYQIYIEDPFKFQFSISTFIDEDPLTIWGYWIDDQGNEQRIDKSGWLKFTPDERLFEGLPKKELFGTNFTFRVYATDGYYTTKDEFIVQPKLLPVMFVINYILVLLGPLMSVIGMIKYRIQLYHLFFTQNYVYGNIIVKSQEHFERLFPLIFDERTIIETMWNNFMKINQKIFDKQFINEQLEIIDIEAYLQEVYNCNKDLKIQKFNPEFILDITSIYYKMMISRAYQYILKTNSFHSKIFKKLIKKGVELIDQNLQPREWYLYYVHIDNIFQPKVIIPNVEFKTENIIRIILQLYQQYSLKKKNKKNTNQEIQRKFSMLNLEYQSPNHHKLIYDFSELQKQCPHLNLDLILNNLKSEALGFGELKFLEDCKGISINKEAADILQVKGFRRSKEKFCSSIFTLLRMTHNPLEMGGNRQLPSWLSCDVAENKIRLYGDPSNIDKGELLVRIISVSEVYLMELTITVVPIDDDEDKRLNLLRLKKPTQTMNSKIFDNQINGNQQHKQNLKDSIQQMNEIQLQCHDSIVEVNQQKKQDSKEVTLDQKHDKTENKLEIQSFNIINSNDKEEQAYNSDMNQYLQLAQSKQQKKQKQKKSSKIQQVTNDD